MIGYCNQVSQLDGKDIVTNEYFNTGDIGKIDDGKLKIIGRIKNIIKVNGKLINLDEIEQIAKSIENVESCVAVHGKYNNMENESYRLYIKVNTHCVDKKNKIRQLISSKLRDGKGTEYCPSSIVFVNEFPLTSSLKIDKPKFSTNPEEYTSEHYNDQINNKKAKH